LICSDTADGDRRNSSAARAKLRQRATAPKARNWRKVTPRSAMAPAHEDVTDAPHMSFSQHRALNSSLYGQRALLQP
jgi:hypothetical protein